MNPVPLHRLQLLTFSDGRLVNSSGGSSQIGHIVGASHQSIHEGKEADISILTDKSHKNPRAAPSTLLNETTSLSESLADAEWVASWIGLCKNLHYDLRQRDTLNREIKIAA
eukprot:8229682-Karenia_brevis.AAC.1